MIDAGAAETAIISTCSNMSKTCQAAAVLFSLVGVKDPLQAALEHRNQRSSSSSLLLLLQPPLPEEFSALFGLLQKPDANLDEARDILEFMLWGPSQDSLFLSENLEQVFARWLHLERAAMLNDIVSGEGGLREVSLSAWKEAQLRFLVQTDAEKMAAAARWVVMMQNNNHEENANLW